MAVRILHAADIHLDCPYSGNASQREFLRECHKRTLHALMETALNLHVDALLLAGDTSHQDDLSYASAQFLYEELQSVLDAGIPVLICRGNHDPALAMSGMKLPEGCIVFSSMEPESYELRDEHGECTAVITGWGFSAPSCSRFPVETVPLKREGVVNIALAHLQLTDIAPGANYAPVSASQLLSFGYEYWALGHVHARQTLNGRLHYPGNLMGADPGEPGVKGASLVTLSPDETPQIRFIPLAPVEWMTVEIQGRGDITNFAEVQSEALSVLSDRMQESSGTQLCARVRFVGEWGCAKDFSGPEGEENLRALSEFLTRRLHACLVECSAAVRVPVRVSDYEHQPHILGQMLEMADRLETDDELADRLYALLRDEKVDLAHLTGYTRSAQRNAARSYIRSLLPGLKERLCQDMTREDV